MSRKKGRLIFRLWVIHSVIFFIIAVSFGYNPSPKPSETRSELQTSALNISPEIFKQLKYRHIGPPGNRVSAVAGVPGDPNVYYAGAATGGIFKTTDGGVTWNPIFDDQIVLTIGSLAVAPSDSNIIWAGTGETWFRTDNKCLPIGNGIYKSSDSGKTWTHVGLEKTGRIGRIVINPQNPDIVFVAAMGHCYGPQEDRGVFRTVDGGKTWKRVLFVDENTGCSDIAINPENTRILYAGMWQTLGETSGGPGSDLYRSKDGGETWKKLTGHGLPDPPIGKIGVAVARSHPRRVYALIETGMAVPRLGKEETSTGVLWMSDDGGENWELVSYDLYIGSRSPYYQRCVVAPDDPNEIYFMNMGFFVSTDGGKTTKRIGQVLHGDHHDMWIDPTNGNRMIQSNDGGVGISVNHGKTWEMIELPIAQMYRVAVDNQVPYYVYGSMQDGPSHRGPSNSLSRGGITRGMWHSVGGGEAGYNIPDPVNNNIVWSPNAPSGVLDRYDLATGHSRSVSAWPDDTWGVADVDLKYRFRMTYPIAISPHDHNKVYIGSQYVHQTTDGGHSWTIISPDLTTNDKTRQQAQPGLSPDSYGNENCAIFAIAESPLKKGLIWVGTVDGQVQVTQDGGAQWMNVTSNIPNLPPWGTVSSIEASRHDPGTCYITVNLNRQNNRDPYVYQTTDYGKSWKSIISGLPRNVPYSVHVRCVREDPVRQGLLYLGTENALYVSFNEGENWLPFLINIPHVPVQWMVVQEHFNDLVVGTYGRGFWILDDITPLHQLTPEVLESDAHLFAPRPAYRFHSKAAPLRHAGDPCVGENPRYGASINYYLKTPETAQVKIIILDEKDQIIRTLNGRKDRGINRVWWDLRSDPSKEEIILRTSPLRAPWMEIGPQGWRRYPYHGGGRISLPMPPGTYKVKLFVGKEEFTQELIVKKDPNSAGSEMDIQAQTKLLMEIRDSIIVVVDMINQWEWVRKQIYDLQALLMKDKGTESVIASGKELDDKIISVEGNLYAMSRTGRGQNSFREASKLMAKLFYLVGSVSRADFPPTTQQIERHEEIKIQLEQYRNQFDEILKKDLPAFNNLLKEKNIPHTITVKIP